MEGAGENREKSNLSGRVNGVSRDLMPKPRNNEEKKPEEDEEIELSLGLSMNGRFGFDPSNKKLKRSSSVSNLAPTNGGGGGHQAHGEASGSHAPLGRTWSLPAETDRSMRSMEARKKRMEKLKNVRVVKEVQNGNGLIMHGGDDNNGGFGFQKNGGNGVLNNGSENLNMNSMLKSSSSHQFPDEQGVEQPAVRAADNDRDEELLKNALLDMPHVSTRGYGPNHGRIEGFLYRYRKGEEVKIVCVCHGLFLSPAEFVKHGGGGDVAQPLKHIVVNPFPLFQV
ncbi:hypothetical protein DH2020_037640 [Rehmannia glutinosa]|uniref:Ninja-family protein n=1 Tax=Rehmannia glutinosa TaxID=99300 RepID=A0ABR0V122_REHGL